MASSAFQPDHASPLTADVEALSSEVHALQDSMYQAKEAQAALNEKQGRELKELYGKAEKCVVAT